MLYLMLQHAVLSVLHLLESAPVSPEVRPTSEPLLKLLALFQQLLTYQSPPVQADIIVRGVLSVFPAAVTDVTYTLAAMEELTQYTQHSDLHDLLQKYIQLWCNTMDHHLLQLFNYLLQHLQVCRDVARHCDSDTFEALTPLKKLQLTIILTKSISTAHMHTDRQLQQSILQHFPQPLMDFLLVQSLDLMDKITTCIQQALQRTGMSVLILSMFAACDCSPVKLTVQRLCVPLSC